MSFEFAAEGGPPASRHIYICILHQFIVYPLYCIAFVVSFLLCVHNGVGVVGADDG